AVNALGKDQVVGLILPEKESNPLSGSYAGDHARQLGIEHREIDISSTVESVFSYTRRDEYIRKLIPEFRQGCRYNIVLPSDLLERDSYSVYVLQVQLPDGSIRKKRLSTEGFRFITSCANIKIRARMLHLYAEADRRNLVVAGTTNRTEYLLGDFCRYGDGGTDVEPIAHLYKDQIYQIARYLEVPREIIERVPSPDTFSLPVSDQEFFFRIPFEKLDLLLYAWEHAVDEVQTAQELDLPLGAVRRAFQDFTTKNRATRHLRNMPYSLCEPASG
ncbi:MAG: NAD(+) synthase, partial [Desulfomonilia bacterium]|nr:NAD(+) synthase [Desulfomonilia bacterium]